MLANALSHARNRRRTFGRGRDLSGASERRKRKFSAGRTHGQLIDSPTETQTAKDRTKNFVAREYVTEKKGSYKF